jgi:hypothetical protein
MTKAKAMIQGIKVRKTSLHSVHTPIPAYKLLPDSDRNPVERNDPYLQSGGLSEPISNSTTALPIRTRLTVISIDILFPIKLPEKLVVCLQSLLCVWKSYLAPLLTRELAASTSSGSAGAVGILQAILQAML